MKGVTDIYHTGGGGGAHTIRDAEKQEESREMFAVIWSSGFVNAQRQREIDLLQQTAAGYGEVTACCF